MRYVGSEDSFMSPLAVDDDLKCFFLLDRAYYTHDTTTLLMF